MLVDANVLLYARDATSPFHRACATWLEDNLNGPRQIGIPWPSLLAFQRIATHPRAFDAPLAPEEAWEQVEEWLTAPASWIPLPTERHREVLGGLVRAHQVAGNLVPDAHLAALAIEHGLPVCTVDTDFARFREVRWVNPTDP